MAHYAQGDGEAFKTLFERISDRLYAYVCRHVYHQDHRDDVIQNIFLKIHQVKERYHPGFSLDPWLFTISRHVVIDHLRKSKQTPPSIEITQEAHPDFETHVKSEYLEFRGLAPLEGAPKNQASLEETQQLLSGMSAREKNILEQRYFDEKSFQDIAHSLGLKESNVRQILSRATRQLQRWAQKV